MTAEIINSPNRMLKSSVEILEIMRAAVTAPTNLPIRAMPTPERSMDFRSRSRTSNDKKNPPIIIGTGTKFGFRMSKIGAAMSANPILMELWHTAPRMTIG
jgi:hypothetical protein